MDSFSVTPEPPRKRPREAPEPRTGDGRGEPPDLAAETRASSEAVLLPPDLRVPGFTVLAHPDLRRVGERAPLLDLAVGREEALSRLRPLFSQPHLPEPRPLADPYLSRSPLRLLPGRVPGSLVLDPSGLATPVELDGRPLGGPHELTRADLERGAVLLLARRVALVLSQLDAAPSARTGDLGLVGESLGIVELRRDIERLARLDVPILVRGETGTGKELVARALHARSGRSRGPFVAVNLGAVPPTLAAAELFGAARGAYTGAERRRAGAFQRANGGTLLLDEIGEAPPEVQVLLLRALESGEVHPVGAEEPIAVDVRLVAATDATLESAMAAGSFRAPLYHRLSGYELMLPPLRERREDVGRLLFHFLARELAALGAADRLAPQPPGERSWLSPRLVARLTAAPWPGNVRQLANVARRIAIASHDAPQAALPERASSEAADGSASTSPAGACNLQSWRHPSQVDPRELAAVLEEHGYRPQAAARALGIARSSLYERLARVPGLRTAAQVDPEDARAALARARGDVEAAARDLRVSPAGLRRRLRGLGLA